MTSDSIFAGLAPSLVWAEFEQILSIPRPSKHEQLIREYLLSFASRHSLASRVDAKGNVVISKGATLGFEDRPVVVLQNHMDMVCEKNSDVSHDFMVDPISAYVDGGWVRARGTTLGADCGIGMAMALAVLRDDSVSHPSLEALFTVDEEQGLSGAFELDPSIISGRYLINLDSEDDGEIYIGCAGGVDTFGRFPLVYSRGEGSLIEVSVSGLLGGHSGDDIDKGRGCSLKILGWILQSVLDLVSDARLVSIEGGNLRNAIAREASASLVVPSCWVSRVLDLVARLSSSYSSLFSRVEPELRVSCLDLV
ncbi:MAG: M20/M25/M40 family metallo-hydrolase [Rikenellaceae bacterium]